MTNWQAMMLSILPLLVISARADGWRTLEPKLRCWTVMLAAAVTGQALEPTRGEMPFMAYAGIDFMAFLAITARPYMMPQRLIAAGFLAMFGLDICAIIGGSDGTGWFHLATLILGYAMLFLLLAWGVGDAGRGAFADLWRSHLARGVEAVNAPRGQGGEP